MATLYHFDDSGVLVDVSLAQRNPEERDVVWLVPRNATLVPPPEVSDKAGLIPCWNGAGWEVKEDNRGKIWNTETCESIFLETAGPIPEGWTSKQPPAPFFVWDGDDWVKPAPTAAQLEERRMLALREDILNSLAAGGTVDETKRQEFVSLLSKRRKL